MRRLALAHDHPAGFRQLGGDFLCVRTLDDRRVSLILGDVMGKGLPAGLVAVYLEGVYLQLTGEPAEILTTLNRCLAAFAPHEALFATAVCVEADLEQNLWKVSRAGHELPSRADLGGPPHLPLGLDPEEVFTQVCAPLVLGERVLLASDGVTDRLGALAALRLEGGLAPLVELLDRGGPLSDDASLAMVRVLSAG
jgi:serine phosphatase RsbU (regulator of sigma subunit)